MFYMAVLYSFNFFGSIVALALNFDGISSERESKFLDLVLTSGISKKKVYLSKVLAGVIVSGVFSVIYVAFLSVIYFAKSGNLALSVMTFRYFFPITAFLSIFSLMGLMFSVIFRSSKTSLITAVIIGGLLMPGLFVNIIDGLAKVFNFGEKMSEVLYMISPACIMNVLNGYSEKYFIIWGLVIVALYLAGIIIIGSRVFLKQDELNYGE
jgi:ABC-type transport system involved in multi-copper enzyme maturation permease subunit